MVGHDVSYKVPGAEVYSMPAGRRGADTAQAPVARQPLVARLHVDLCRLASAICPC